MEKTFTYEEIGEKFILLHSVICKERIEHFIKTFDITNLEINVVKIENKYDNKYLVIDGHHRLIASMLKNIGKNTDEFYEVWCNDNAKIKIKMNIIGKLEDYFYDNFGKFDDESDLIVCQNFYNFDIVNIPYIDFKEKIMNLLKNNFNLTLYQVSELIKSNPVKTASSLSINLPKFPNIREIIEKELFNKLSVQIYEYINYTHPDEYFIVERKENGFIYKQIATHCVDSIKDRENWEYLKNKILNLSDEELTKIVRYVSPSMKEIEIDFTKY